MHIADPKLGIFGANGIVAAGLPIAVGAATAAQLRADGSVAVAFFGDGAPAQGAFHEALNLAAVWQLPVIFFCENNGYAEFSPAERNMRRRSSNAPRATAFRTSRSTATTSWRPRPRWRTWSWPRAPDAVRPSSRPRPTGGTATTKAIRSATDHPTRSRSGRRVTRSSSTRAAFEVSMSATTRSRRSSRRWPASSTARWRRRARWPVPPRPR